jgi:hypothetical protein
VSNVHPRAADAGTASGVRAITIRTDTHITALNNAALAAFTTAPPHRRKQRIPPGPAALAAAEMLRGTDQHSQTVIDLTAYAAAAQNRKTLP